MTIVPSPTSPGVLRKWLFYAALLITFALVTWFWYTYMPMRSHWTTFFRPAIHELLSFRTPYSVEGFYNPPWGLIPLIPFYLLPERLGWALLATTTFFVYGFVAHKMGAKWYLIALMLLLPHTLYSGLQVNVDWLVAIGFILPPKYGLFLILLKPQLGFPLALFWFIEEFRVGGIRQVFKTFLPVSVAFGLSFLIYGLYLTSSSELIMLDGASLWPYSIPLGIALFIQSIKSRERNLSILAAPFLSPYIQPYSLSFALLGLLPGQLWTMTGVASLWLYRSGWMIQILIGPFNPGR